MSGRGRSEIPDTRGRPRFNHTVRTWNQPKGSPGKRLLISARPQLLPRDTSESGRTPSSIFLLRAKVLGEKFCCPDPPQPLPDTWICWWCHCGCQLPGGSTCSPDPTLQVQQSRWAGLGWFGSGSLGYSDPQTASLLFPTQNVQASPPSSLCSHVLSKLGGMPTASIPTIQSRLRAKPTYTAEEERLVSISFILSHYSRHLPLPNSKPNPMVSLNAILPGHIDARWRWSHSVS